MCSKFGLPINQLSNLGSVLGFDALPKFVVEKSSFFELPQSYSALYQILGDSNVKYTVENWLEWEETCLRPLAFVKSKSRLASVLKELERHLVSSDYLIGSCLSLADIAVCYTFQQLDWFERPAKLERYFKNVIQFLPTDAPAPTKDISMQPIPGQRNILITSALPYVNNVPHLGNLVGCVLSADCYARYARLRGYNTLFVCGTDEYGTATETKALEEGLSCQDICDKYHSIHKSVYEWFQCSFDIFGRTPTWQQTKICQEIYTDLKKNGYVYEDSVEQLFSETLGKFLADRFVIGTCPKCGDESAKGDQCDNCGLMLNPTDLVNPKCKITGCTPVLRATKHLFLDLPKLLPQLEKYVAHTLKLGGWSSNCIALTMAWMRDGLKPRCISRDLSWGTTIPEVGYESKVFYVWFDACIGYVSITANYTSNWKDWWQNPENVELVQFMGKDNVPFHTLIFPSSQIGTNRKWTMMKQISVTEYLNYEGTKFSKSNGVGVFGTDAKETGIPVEVSDTDFKWSDMRARLNNELLANLGNFINRALVFAYNKFDKKIPKADLSTCQKCVEIKELTSDIKVILNQYLLSMEQMKLRDGIRHAMAVSSRGNKFLQDCKPWELRKGCSQDVADCGAVINVALSVALILAALIEPYMPSVASKILNLLNLTPSFLSLSDEFIANCNNLTDLLPPNHKLNEPEVLFKEISPEIEATLRERFGGDGKLLQSTNLANSKVEVAKNPKIGSGVELDFGCLNLKVGVISSVRKHENADTLFIEMIDIGEKQPRQVVSGLVSHYAVSELIDRKVVVVTNLKAGNIRGIKSEAMVLAASADGKVELLEPPSCSSPGDQVFVEGTVLNPLNSLKKELFTKVTSGCLRTNCDLLAVFNGQFLSTSHGSCFVRSLPNATIG